MKNAPITKEQALNALIIKFEMYNPNHDDKEILDEDRTTSYPLRSNLPFVK